MLAWESSAFRIPTIRHFVSMMISASWISTHARLSGDGLTLFWNPLSSFIFYPFHIRQLNGSNQGVDWAITKLLLMYYNQLPEQHDARATGIYKGHAMPPLWMSPEATLSSITPRSSWTSGKTRQSIESHLLIMKDFFLLKLKWKYKKRIPINALFFFLSSSHQLNLKTKWKMVASLLGKS